MDMDQQQDLSQNRFFKITRLTRHNTARPGRGGGGCTPNIVLMQMEKAFSTAIAKYNLKVINAHIRTIGDPHIRRIYTTVGADGAHGDWELFLDPPPPPSIEDIKESLAALLSNESSVYLMKPTQYESRERRLHEPCRHNIVFTLDEDRTKIPFQRLGNPPPRFEVLSTDDSSRLEQMLQLAEDSQLGDVNGDVNLQPFLMIEVQAGIGIPRMVNLARMIYRDTSFLTDDWAGDPGRPNSLLANALIAFMDEIRRCDYLRTKLRVALKKLFAEKVFTELAVEIAAQHFRPGGRGALDVVGNFEARQAGASGASPPAAASSSHLQAYKRARYLAGSLPSYGDTSDSEDDDVPGTPPGKKPRTMGGRRRVSGSASSSKPTRAPPRVPRAPRAPRAPRSSLAARREALLARSVSDLRALATHVNLQGRSKLRTKRDLALALARA